MLFLDIEPVSAEEFYRMEFIIGDNIKAVPSQNVVDAHAGLSIHSRLGLIIYLRWRSFC